MGDHHDVEGEDQLFEWSGGPPVEYPGKPLGPFLLDCMRRNAITITRPAQIDASTGSSKTHAELLSESVRAAVGWRSLGFSSGDTLAVFTRNNHYKYVATLGAVLEGITLATMSPYFKEDEARPLVARLSLRAMLCEPANVEIALKVVPKGVLVFVAAEHSAVPGTESVGALLRMAGDVNVDAYQATNVADPRTHRAIIVHTSGTSGLPKAVACSNHGVLLGLLLDAWNVLPDDTVLVTAPMSWITGIFLTLVPIFRGASRVFFNYTNERECLDAALKYKITMMALLAPGRYVLLVGLIKSLRERGIDVNLSHLRMLTTGGASMTGELQRMCYEQLGVPIVQIYGSSELLMVSGDYLHGDSTFPHFGSVGKLVPGTRARLVDIRTGRDIRTPNTEGEIRIKSSYYMLGYDGDSEQTLDAVDEHGWFRTGDLAKFDEYDRITITGRIKELLKFMTIQVSPAEVEDVLLKHPAVRSACVVGRRHDIAGDVPTAFVALFPGKNATEQELQDLVRDRLSQCKRLRGGVFFVDEIPLSVNGKPDRNVLGKKLSQLPPVSDDVLGLNED